MTTALICLDGYRTADFLTAAQATLAASMEWLVLHVSDTRPVEEAERALGGLPGRGPGRHRAETHLRHSVAWSEGEVQTAAAEWLQANERTSEVLLRRGRPEREVIRVAEERAVALIALGGGHGRAGRYPGPGPYPLSPVARFVVDHARCDVLLLRGYITAADRRE